MSEDKRDESQARAQLASIVEMITALRAANEADNDRDIENAEQAIQEDPLSVEVREGWHAPGDTGAEPEEFRILLCTGGPAVQIVGELGQFNRPTNPRIQFQDWFVPWTTLADITDDEQDALQVYCEQFYFGD